MGGTQVMGHLVEALVQRCKTLSGGTRSNAGEHLSAMPFTQYGIHRNSLSFMCNRVWGKTISNAWRGKGERSTFAAPILKHMKRTLLLTAVVVGIAGAASAQYKPAAGEATLEVNFAPLGGSPVSIAGIKYRSFGTETSAFRLGVFLGFGSTTTITQDEDTENGATAKELKDSESTFSINIQPGIEKHFAGTERLSPYIGGVLNLGYEATSEKSETQFTSTLVGEDVEKGGSLNVGLNAVAGFDYYVANKLYLGTELGFGVAMSKDMTKKVTTQSLNQNGDALESDDTESNVDNKSEFNVGPNVNAQIRLGWVF